MDMIPEDVLNVRHFKEWYNTVREAGHQIVDVKQVEWVKRIGKFPLFAAIHVAIKPFSEDRVKDNETVIIRPSTSHVAVWARGENTSEDRFLLVKEYRTTVMNTKGFVYELPGGSSFEPDADPSEVASKRLFEETGEKFEADRFCVVGIAQCAPTMIANRAFVMRIILTSSEMDRIENMEGWSHGNINQGEITYICVRTRKQIMNPMNDEFGWDLRGMISSLI